MKSLILILAVVSLFNAYPQDTLTILHINDTHSSLASLSPRTPDLKGTQGGIARAASVIFETKAIDSNVLLLHAGDIFAGDIFFNKFFGIPELQLMEQLGFDAMTLGNHEFDLGPSTLQEALDNAFNNSTPFPILSANADLENFPSLKQYVKRYTLKEFGNLKIGIFGLTTDETNYYSLPSPVQFSSDYFSIAAEMVDTLSANGCDVIILLSHLGINYDQAIAANIPGIHIIISGHDHFKTEEEITIINSAGKETWIVQSDAFYKSIGKMKIVINQNQVSLLNYNQIILDNTIPEEPSIAQVISSLITEVENTYPGMFSQQIGSATSLFEEVANNLTSHGYHDTHVGNLITDAFRWKTGTDIAIEVGGSTSQVIQQGIILPVDAFRTIGYGFNIVNGLGYRLVKFKIKGSELIKALEFGLQYIEYNDELFPQVSGMSYSYDANDSAFNRVRSVLIGNEPLNPDQYYSITTNEFLKYALDNLVGVETIEPYLYEDLTEFQVLTEYIAGQQIITPSSGVRIISSLRRDENALPEKFNLQQNYPNPFNPSTKIIFTITEPSFTKIKIYNTIGEEISALVNEELKAGNYEIDFSADNLPSGIYFYRLETNKSALTKKMVLLR